MSTSTDQSAQTSQLAQSLPGFDAAPDIASLEQSLLNGLGAPIQQALGELPLQQFSPTSAAAGDPQGLAGLAHQLDPFNLITPVINGLGTLGSGQFSGLDPTQMLSGISSAFDGSATPLQQSADSLANNWQGQSGTAADASTRAAVANGAEVANQADGLNNNLSSATANVAQARQQMIEIIDEYQAKMAAADLSTPAGKRAAVAAGNQANAEATAVMQELQGNLSGQAQQVSAIGTPVGVTQTPVAGGSMAGGPIGSMAASADPTGVLSTVLGDSRLNPKSFAGNAMDLLFLPQTMTELNQGMAQTNRTMTQTNSIMTGLGRTMRTTNSTIGHTNSIMTGLGKTIGNTNTIMSGLGDTLDTTNQNLATTNTELQPLPGALDDARTSIDKTTGAMGDLKKDLSGPHGLHNDMGTLHHDLGQTNKDVRDLNNKIPKLPKLKMPHIPVPHF
jgi:hypothetical protein